MPKANKSEQSAYQNQWMKRRRYEWLKEHGPCVKCKSEEALVVVYKTPAKRVKRAIWSLSLAKRKAELSKCKVLCVRCWRKEHAERRIQHGTRGRYDKGCRCELCRAEKARYQKNLRARLRSTARFTVHRKKNRRQVETGGSK